MTSVEQILYQAVIANSGITNLLGTFNGKPAFYDKQIPQQANAYPAGVYQRIAAPRLFVQAPVANQASVGRARFRLTFWATGANGTATLGNLDFAVLNMFRTFDAYNVPGSPETFVQAGFTAYSSRTLIEPNTQPPLQKLEIDTTFWFQDQ